MKNKKIIENNMGKILLAEDSLTQAEQLKYILEKYNYKVIVAKNGKEALGMVIKHKPSLIISDIVMPEMNGYELCKEIKSNEATIGIPVILLTSLSNSEDVLEGISCGADNFITKPYNEDYLVSHIEQILANRKINTSERVRVGVEITFGGKKRFITASQQQMLTLLISTYEAAVQRNSELTQAQDELKKLNEHLEELVKERTAALVEEIANRKLSEEKVVKLNRVYALLSKINQTIVRIHDTKQLFKDVCQIVIDEGKFQSAWIGIVNNETKEIETSASAGLINNLIKVNPDNNPALMVISAGKQFISNNIDTDNTLSASWKKNALSLGFKSFAAFPLVFPGKATGSFCIYSNEPGYFDELEISLLDEVVTDISFALEYIQKESDRKWAEKALSASEIRYRRLFESAKDGILILDAESGIIVDVNPFLVELLGYSKEQFLEKKIWEIGIFKDKIANKNNFLELQQKEYIRYDDFPLKAIDGRQIDVEFVSNAYFVNHHKVMQCNIRDITESKIAEKALKESEEKFRKIFEDHSAVKLLIDPYSGEIIDANKAAAVYYGWSQEELKRMKIEQINTLIPEEVNKEMKNALSQKRTQFEFRHRRKDGSIRDVEVFSSKIEIGNKEVLHSIIHDITERKLAEKALRVSEEKFRNYIECAPDGVLILDDTGRYIEVNRSACQITGYSKEEIEKMFIHDLLADESLEDGLAHFKKLKETGAAISDLWHKHKDGSKRYLTISAVKLSETLVLGFCKDITKRKQTEEALASEQYLMYALMNNVPDRIYFKDRDSKFIRISKAQAKLFDLNDPTQAISKSDFDFFTNEHAQQAYEDEQEIIRTGKTIIKEEKETWPDRPDTWVHSTKLPLRDKEANIIGTFGISMDITVRKETELILIQKNQEIESQNEEYLALNDEIEQTNKELLLAKEKAEESDKLKTAFLQNMSHEIRTPMNGILGFAELLKNPRLPDVKQQEFIKIIEKSGQRMLNIISDIVNISKIETGQIELDLKETNVNGLLLYLHTFFTPEAERKGLIFNFKPGLSDKLCKIETDESKLTQVLSNLIGNALKFTKAGSIDFGYQLKGKVLEFYIHDTGIGIAPEMQEIIFERFRQVDMADARIYEGAGLGLAISKAFVEKLSGRIWVQSEIDEGSVFFFSIPYNPMVIIREEKPLEAVLEAKLSGINILIVEDDYVCMELLKELLDEEKANLFFANDGQEALDIVKSTPEIQIVLMDLKMPIMNGFEATKLIKKLKPGLPVIAQSAYAFSNDRDKSIMAGCDDFIGKPVKLELLLSMINKQLTKK